jgi:catalase-peroxidase
MGLGWHNRLGSGMAEHTITSGIEGAWKPNPTRWDQGYFEMMFTYEWELTKSPAGAWQWVAKDVAPEHMIPDAHVAGRSAAPIMTTADLSLRFDPILAPIAQRFRDDHQAFADTFARAWYKLTHRDLGPRALHLGPEVPAEELIWQDPLPPVDHPLIEAAEVAQLRERVWAAGLGVGELVATAWASASTFRGSDRRGGANGARLRLAPQRSWEVNDPPQLARVLEQLEQIQAAFQADRVDGKRVSLADLIVLAGGFAVEKAAQAAGFALEVPFHPGRTDARDDQTDSASFNVLKPSADGFRNWESAALELRAEELLIDRAQQLSLSAPELTVLVGGLRVLGANSGGSRHGVFTDRPGVLSPDFFTHLLDMAVQWAPTDASCRVYEGRSRSDGQLRWTATRADLIFGSHSQLRAIAEVYAQSDGAERFAADFVRAWVKVMELDRFDLAG